VKGKTAKSELGHLYEGMSPRERANLEKRYDCIVSPPRQAVNKIPLKLSDEKGTSIASDVYYMVFREGTLFIHAPESGQNHGIADLLASRSSVINDLLKQRMPTLVSFCVLVADLQNSVRICAELPPEEYFELVSQTWACVEGSFKKYYGTYGKHTGDGMLYYFLKERDNQYMINAVSCALEIRGNIKTLNMEWKARKGWFNEICLNIGINEGQEYFGAIPSAPSVEFTALGDTVNYAGRLSDFARYGSIWTTKNLINKLSTEERSNLRYGIRHLDHERETWIENSFSRVMDMIAPDNINSNKFMDIATLAVTEILGRR
jgi:class 3 adenylate cyclase